ncbi:hypothetical protein GCM10009555_079150 [Acrocarpospora macrocephala]|uniref:CHAT domain-containing protein n=1 Tax=Acrocarpospora macrocephala TaxID=150177 RepID=A0A5M3X6P5_9ACTN|nr:CHAT domain-containing protein [Acrocarpospora macrocephala]GES16332.1 hypothetical protein Amac_099300 [Acrocarpospora macrocephala]
MNLDERIAALLAAPRDTLADFQLAGLLCSRHLGFDGQDSDRDTAIGLFEGLLGRLDAEREHMARFGAGVLRLARVVPIGRRGGRPADFAAVVMPLLTGRQLSAGAQADVAAVIELITPVTRDGQAPPEVVAHATGLLTMATLLRHLARLHRGELSYEEMLPLLTKAVTLTTALPPSGPHGTALQALLKAAHLRLDPDAEIIDDTIEELAQAVGLAGSDELLRVILLRELGLARALRGQAGAPATDADLAAAPELLEQALDALRPGHPLYEDTMRMVGGALLTRTAFDPTPGGIARLLALAARGIAEHGDTVDDTTRAKDLFLLGMAQLVQATHLGDRAAGQETMSNLRRAAELIPPGDEFAPMIVGVLGAALSDRHQFLGRIEDAEAAGFFLERSRQIMDLQEAADRDVRALRIMTGLTRVILAMRLRDLDGLDAGIEQLAGAHAAMTPLDPGRGRVEGVLAIARIFRGHARDDGEETEEGIDLMISSATAARTDQSDRAALVTRAGLALLLRGISKGDRGLLSRAIELLERAKELPEPPYWLGPRLEQALGNAYLARFKAGNAPGDLESAIRHLEASPGTGELAEAYREAGRGADAVAAGLDALRGHADDVLAQAGPGHGLMVARGAAERAVQVAGWALAQGRAEAAVEALELGRGLVLHAATAAGELSALLTAHGHADLAAAWESARPPDVWSVEGAAGSTAALMNEVLDRKPPDELRQRVLAVLRGTPAHRALRSAPSVPEIAGALGEASALVYLLPSVALVVPASGDAHPIPLPDTDFSGYVAAHEAFRRTLDRKAWREALEQVPAREIMERLPDGPLVLVPTGVLGLVPWHAATEAVVSYAASARQLTQAAGRGRAPLRESPVLVGNPTRDELFWSRREVAELRRAHYPGAPAYGRFPGSDGTATAERVLGRMSASMAHLACHAVSADPPPASHLKLADRELSVTEILALERTGGPGGLVVLSACVSDLSVRDHDETLTLAAAFLQAGASGVIGSRWLVAEDPRTAALMFVLHHHLASTGPARALRAAQRWMADPGRAPLLPDTIAHEIEDLGLDLADPAVWAAFTHQGI